MNGLYDDCIQFVPREQLSQWWMCFLRRQGHEAFVTRLYDRNKVALTGKVINPTIITKGYCDYMIASTRRAPDEYLRLPRGARVHIYWFCVNRHKIANVCRVYIRYRVPTLQRAFVRGILKYAIEKPPRCKYLSNTALARLLRFLHGYAESQVNWIVRFILKYIPHGIMCQDIFYPTGKELKWYATADYVRPDKYYKNKYIIK